MQDTVFVKPGQDGVESLVFTHRLAQLTTPFVDVQVPLSRECGLGVILDEGFGNVAGVFVPDGLAAVIVVNSVLVVVGATVVVVVAAGFVFETTRECCPFGEIRSDGAVGRAA